MESAQESVEITIRTSVSAIQHKNNLWWVLFDGSWEWLNLGPEQPAFLPGDKFDIILRRTHAKSSQPSVE